ncbi:hypothetical protein KBTX_04199 [wastewater metagenome]|uniref:N-acetyltransferase domain-containing protein n=2 Tax=unclassified sequences TaxID=12908 RepID=A0A5B8RJU2_9ZZZZ|nr:hypothetical protein KBTEX_04199 [uncultured organism]
MEKTTWKKENYTLTTEQSLFDHEAIYHYLTEESYWALGMPRNVFEKSLEHSLCFGLFAGDPSKEQAEQIGFARVISDHATFAYLADVFILEAYRGRGLSKWMMAVILDHPELRNLRRFMLATQDAHTLYERFGFGPLATPEKMMEISKGKSVYERYR